MSVTREMINAAHDVTMKKDEGADYERGFADGMQYQMQKSVDKAVNAMARKWVGLTDEEIYARCNAFYRWSEWDEYMEDWLELGRSIEAALKEKNTHGEA